MARSLCRSLSVPILMLAAGGLLQGPLAAVLTSISVDGDMGDWSAVLADLYQHSFDGPSGGQIDPDAPVQSTGRDLLEFAWTHDAGHLFFYVQRVASSSNRQLFWFYIDTGDDGLMESGEPVVGVSWFGSNRRTEVELYSYTAAAAAGDPLGGPLADGWDMPGTVALVRPLESTRGGAASGVEMEARVAWSDLGLTPGAVVRFHLASSNSANLPAQLDDNMGGPGGAVGTTLLPGVGLAPDRSVTVVPAGLAVLAHTLANHGNGSDSLDLDWSAAGDFTPSTVVFHLDADGDGRLGPGDPQLVDTTGDGRPDTGPVPAGASLAVLAVAAAPAGLPEGQVASVTVRASSAAGPSVSAQVVDILTVAVPSVTLAKTVDRATAEPGDRLTYSVTYAVSGSTGSYSVVMVDAVPPPTVYVPGSAAGPGLVISFSHDGGATFDGSEASPVTHIRWAFPGPLPPGATGTVTFQVQVP